MAASATGSPQMFTDWDGLMDDLFHSREVNEFIQSPHESSSGIASESPTWHVRPPSSSNSSLSTYKMGSCGARSSSPDTTDEVRALAAAAAASGSGHLPLKRFSSGRQTNGGYSSSGGSSSNDFGYGVYPLPLPHCVDLDLQHAISASYANGGMNGHAYHHTATDAVSPDQYARDLGAAANGPHSGCGSLPGPPPPRSLRTGFPATAVPTPRPRTAVRGSSSGGRSSSAAAVSCGPTVDALSDAVLLRVLSRLPTDSLCRCARVCRRWYNLVWDPSLWTRLRLGDASLDVDRALKQLLRRLSQETPRVCIALESISLSGSVRLTDRGLRLIARRCPELRRLELAGCAAISNAALCEVVSSCVNLLHLDTTGCTGITCVSLTPEAAAAAAAMPHGSGGVGGGKQILLRYLDMTDCSQLEDTGLQVIASYCTHLQYVYLRRCERVGDLGLQYLAAGCAASLRELSVSDCRRVTDFGVRELSARLELGLRYLSVSKCERVSDAGVTFVARHCRKLRYLNVRGCEAVSDDGIEAVARSCGARLRSLDVGKCDVTDASLLVVAQHCARQLRRLSLRGCDAVTDEGVLAVARSCTRLRELDVQGCRLSADVCRTLRRLLKGCVIEHTNPGLC